jgi:hypothetical protein
LLSAASCRIWLDGTIGFDRRATLRRVDGARQFSTVRQMPAAPPPATDALRLSRIGHPGYSGSREQAEQPQAILQSQ